jgi:hypothetical protein
MKWAESIAVGNMEIAGEAKPKLGARAIGRKILEAVDNGDYELRETQSPCNPLFTPEKCSPRIENGYF